MASPLSLDVGYLFCEFQCLPVDDCSEVGFDSGALTRGSESMSFYSAILNQSLSMAVFQLGCFCFFDVELYEFFVYFGYQPLVRYII